MFLIPIALHPAMPAPPFQTGAVPLQLSEAFQARNNTQPTISDPNDFYYYGAQRIRLNRSLTELVVKFKTEALGARQRVVESLSSSARLGEEIPNQGHIIQIVTLPDSAGGSEGIARFADQLRQRDELDFVAAVFYHPETGTRMLPTDEIVVKRKPEVTTQELASLAGSLDLTVVKPIFGTQDEFVLRLNTPKGSDPVEKSHRLYESGRFIWAEPNFVQQYQKHAVPNDPLFGQQWHLSNTGQGGGTEGADVKAPAAWNLQQWSSAITIAVIDNGVEKTHEDLAANIFINPGEIPGNWHLCVPLQRTTRQIVSTRNRHFAFRAVQRCYSSSKYFSSIWMSIQNSSTNQPGFHCAVL